MAISIREVLACDVLAVLELVAEVLSEFGLELGKGSSTDDALHDLPASYAIHGGAFWVACDGDSLLGTCGVFPVEPGTFELRKMYLSPGARGFGLGKALLDTAIAWVVARRGERIVLDTIERMTRAIAFYEARGFTRDDTQIRGARCSRGYVLNIDTLRRSRRASSDSSS